MKIKGYTLHGDYYLANNVTPCKNWQEACEMKEIITLPNGKKVIAHTLSKKELETIPREERGIRGYWYWYWINTITCDGVWYMNSIGDFNYYNIRYCSYSGGARLGFHKNEIKRRLLNIE